MNKSNTIILFILIIFLIFLIYIIKKYRKNKNNKKVRFSESSFNYNLSDSENCIDLGKNICDQNPESENRIGCCQNLIEVNGTCYPECRNDSYPDMQFPDSIPCCPGFKGTKCNYSDSKTCNNKGIVNDSGICSCNDSNIWSGVDCNTRVCNATNNGGIPDKTDTTKCVCNSGWAGENCDIRTGQLVSINSDGVLCIDSELELVKLRMFDENGKGMVFDDKDDTIICDKLYVPSINKFLDKDLDTVPCEKSKGIKGFVFKKYKDDKQTVEQLYTVSYNDSSNVEYRLYDNKLCSSNTCSQGKKIVVKLIPIDLSNKLFNMSVKIVE